MSFSVEKIVFELRQNFEALYGERLANMVLFGSHARGDADPGSDIDIMVILEGVVNPGKEIARTGDITAELSLKYDVMVSCIFMPSTRFATEQSPLLMNVRREGITA
jgi:predicted nucleotidyltransferase